MGLVALLVAGLAVGSLLLSERLRLARELASRLEARSEPGGRADLGPAEELAAARRGRIDWAPKLAAVAERIEADLALARIECHSASRNTPARLVLTGRARPAGAEVEIAGRVMARLGEDPRITEDFPGVQIEALPGDRASEITLVCRRPGGEP